MTGIQYELLSADEPKQFYLIRKHKREDASKVTPLAYYYCLHGILSSRRR